MIDTERYVDTRTHAGLCALHLAVLCGSQPAGACGAGWGGAAAAEGRSVSHRHMGVPPMRCACSRAAAPSAQSSSLPCSHPHSFKAVAELVSLGAQLDTPLLVLGFRAPAMLPACLAAGSTALHMAAATGRAPLVIILLHAARTRHPGLELRRWAGWGGVGGGAGTEAQQAGCHLAHARGCLPAWQSLS